MCIKVFRPLRPSCRFRLPRREKQGLAAGMLHQVAIHGIEGRNIFREKTDEDGPAWTITDRPLFDQQQR